MLMNVFNYVHVLLVAVCVSDRLGDRTHGACTYEESLLRIETHLPVFTAREHG